MQLVLPQARPRSSSIRADTPPFFGIPEGTGQLCWRGAVPAINIGAAQGGWNGLESSCMGVSRGLLRGFGQVTRVGTGPCLSGKKSRRDRVLSDN